MTETGAGSSPPRRTWALAALVIALALTAVIAILTRPRAPFAPPAANTTRTEKTAMELPSYAILRTSGPIAIDGVLDEAVWGRLEPVGAFMLHDGSAPAEFETEAKLCWDDEYLYVSFSCVDNDIWGTFTERDQPLYDEEVVEIFINPSNDLVNYFEFEVSPRNVIWDGRIYNPDGAPNENMRYDESWDCEGLLTGVRVVGTLDDRSDLDQLWSVEMAIPFASIERKTPADGEQWRANLYRIDRGEKDEFSCWSPTQNVSETPAFHIPSRFGRFIFSAREA